MENENSRAAGGLASLTTFHLPFASVRTVRLIALLYHQDITTARFLGVRVYYTSSVREPVRVCLALCVVYMSSWALFCRTSRAGVGEHLLQG